MRAEDHGGARLRTPDDRRLHAPDADRVEPRERLVEQQRPGLVQQPAGDRELLLHSPGELSRQGVALRFQLQFLEHTGNPRVHVRHLVEPAHEAQVLLDREVVEQVRLVRDEGEERLCGHRLAPQVVPTDPDSASAGYDDASDAPDGRGLPGTVRPDQSQYLPRLHPEGKPADRRKLAVELLEPLDLDHGKPVAGGHCRWGAFE